MVEGFRRMYRFLLDHRDALLGSDPLRELAHEQVRFVFRATRVYALILRNLQNRRYLRDGADRSIQLEQLGRAQVPPRDGGRAGRETALLARVRGRAPGDGRERCPVLHRPGQQRRLDRLARRGDRRCFRSRASTSS